MTALASRLLAEVRGAVARGWCAPANSTKVMDTDLAEAIAQEVCALMQAEAAAALSVRVPEGDMARALEWLRGFGWVVPDTVKSAIEEAIAAYDPSAGAATGIMVEVDGVRFAVPPSVAQKVCAALAPCDNMPLSGRESGAEVHVGADSVDLRWVSKEAKWAFNGRIGVHPLFTDHQPSDGWNATDDDVRAWLARHDHEGMSLTDARSMFDDARSAHMLAAAPSAKGV